MGVFVFSCEAEVCLRRGLLYLHIHHDQHIVMHIGERMIRSAAIEQWDNRQ
jgi:hypothetical protein